MFLFYEQLLNSLIEFGYLFTFFFCQPFSHVHHHSAKLCSTYVTIAILRNKLNFLSCSEIGNCFVFLLSHQIHGNYSRQTVAIISVPYVMMLRGPKMCHDPLEGLKGYWSLLGLFAIKGAVLPDSPRVCYLKQFKSLP